MILGIISGALGLMLVHWMQPGHILDFVPKRLVKVPEGLSDQETIDFYWDNVQDNFLLRMCICEVCLSVHVFAGMFLIFGEHSVFSFIAGLAGSYLVVRYAP